MMAFFLTMPIKSTMPITATMSTSSPAIHNASSAPTPAEGKVERMVTGWIVLSYSTPSTMYMVTTAARMSSSVFDNEA